MAFAEVPCLRTRLEPSQPVLVVALNERARAALADSLSSSLRTNGRYEVEPISSELLAGCDAMPEPCCPFRRAMHIWWGLVASSLRGWSGPAWIGGDAAGEFARCPSRPLRVKMLRPYVGRRGSGAETLVRAMLVEFPPDEGYSLWGDHWRLGCGIQADRDGCKWDASVVMVSLPISSVLYLLAVCLTSMDVGRALCEHRGNISDAGDRWFGHLGIHAPHSQQGLLGAWRSVRAGILVLCAHPPIMPMTRERFSGPPSACRAASVCL
jgi:hypothetical protein